MRASVLLGRARREDDRRRGRGHETASTDPPYFPYYSKRLDRAGRFLQSNLVDPSAEYARGVYEEASDIASDTGSRMLNIALKCMAVMAWLALTFVCAVFLYAVLYWFIVPQKEYKFPLYFDYGAGHISMSPTRQRVMTTTTELPPHSAAGAQETSPANLVSTSILQHVDAPPMPLATVDLLSSHTPWNITDIGRRSNSDGGDTVGTHLLVAGQPYTATVRLVMPESPTNVNMPGALMVNVELLASGNRVMARSARPVVMRHRSWPVRWARWALLMPAFFVGLIDEAQTHSLICFDKYVEAQTMPLAAVRVWLSDGHVQVYRADLFVIAELKGLGYYMYHWFFTSWAVGVSVLWFWNLFSCLVVYAMCCTGSENRELGEGYVRSSSDGTGDDLTKPSDDGLSRRGIENNWAPSQRDHYNEYEKNRLWNRPDGVSLSDEGLLQKQRGDREGRPSAASTERENGDSEAEEDEGDLAEILANGEGGEAKKKDQ